MKKRYKDGGFYEGEGTLLTKKRQGKGTMVYHNGYVYEGEWKNDVRCGQGVCYKMGLKGSYYYVGEWKDDQLNGEGEFHGLGTVYKGGFLNGKYHGNGVLDISDSNKSRYEGSFEDGKKSGYGVETTDAYTYEGNFKNGIFNGTGKKTLKNGDYFEGTFVSGCFSEGKAKTVFKDCKLVFIEVLTTKHISVYKLETGLKRRRS